MTDLHYAVKDGDDVRVREILRRNPSCVNDRDEDYNTPLHYLGNGDAPLIGKILIDHGADVNAREEKDLRTPLHVACVRRQAKVIELLLEHGANTNLRDANGNTVLHCIYVYSDCPLHDKSILELLLRQEVEINAVNNYDSTPLDAAIYYEKFDRECDALHPLTILVEAGAKSRDILCTLLHPWAIDSGTLKFLIRHGSEIFQNDKFSTKAMYFILITISDNDDDSLRVLEDFFKILHEDGIDVDSLICEGEENTELHIAVKNLDEAEVRALLRAGADVNAKNVCDQTPLHLLMCIALSKEQSLHDRIQRIAVILIEAGADFLVRDCFNTTSFQLAEYRALKEVINSMIVKVTNLEEDKIIRLTSKISQTLYFAIVTCNYGIAKMLLEANCQIDGHYIPKIDLANRGDNLKLLCLLWEYSCILILKRSLAFALSDIARGIIRKKVGSLLIFYYKIGLRSNKLSKDFIPMSAVFNSNRRLSSIFASCDDQIDQLEKDIVCGCLSKFDLLTMKLDSLVKFLNDEKNLNSCEKLCLSFDDGQEMEYHEYAIKIRLDLAIEKRKLLDAAKDKLNEALQENFDCRRSKYLPDEIVWNILSYLNVRELKKMSIEN